MIGRAANMASGTDAADCIEVHRDTLKFVLKSWRICTVAELP